MTMEDKRPLIVIGTSGSTDYLRDMGDKRYWPVVVADDGEPCDGLHDEGAPAIYLCSRCYPQPQGDLFELAHDEYDENRRDDDGQME